MSIAEKSAHSKQAAGQLQRAQRQRDRLLDEAEVVRLQHLAQIEVVEVRRDPLVDHLHHFVGRDAVGEHAGDEGAGAGADVDVEVVDGAVDGEKVEGAEGADLVDAACHSAAAEHQGGLRRAFAAPASARSRGLDIHNFAHQRGLSQEMRWTPPSIFVLILAAERAFGRPGRLGGGIVQRAPGPGGPRRRRRQRPVRARRGHRPGDLPAGPEPAILAGLEHEAVHDRDRDRPARPGSAGSRPRSRRPAASMTRASSTAASTCVGGGDPALGTPSFYDRFLGGLGTNLYALKAQIRAAGIDTVRGRLYADDTVFDRLRGVADSGYATSPYIGPLSGLAFDSGYSSSNATASPPTRPGWRRRSWRDRSTPPGSTSGRRSRSGRRRPTPKRSRWCARRRSPGWRRRPTSRRTTSTPRR